MFRPLVVLLLCASFAVAAPVPKAVKKSAVPQVAGTTWVGAGGPSNVFHYTFHDDGTFTAKHPDNGREYSKGTWKQEGDRVEWEFSGRYSVYTVTFQDGGFEGTGVNKANSSWAVTLKTLPK